MTEILTNPEAWVALITLVVMTFDLGGSSDVPPSHHGRRRAH